MHVASLKSKAGRAAYSTGFGKRLRNRERVAVSSLITRRGALQLLGGAGLTAVSPVSRAWADAGGASLTFLAVGDWGRDGQFHQREVAARMGETAQRLGIRFVISVGDNFYENGVTGLEDPAWQRSFENVYDHSALQVPWWVSLGNHDYQGNSQAQVDYSLRSKRWRLPARWYSFGERSPDGATAEFFVLDTPPMILDYYRDGAVKVQVADQESNVPVQLDWLERGLARSRADWKVVVGHHPIYSGKPARKLSPIRDDDAIERMAGGSPELVKLVGPILRRHRVPLYLNGHVHDLQHVARDGTHYICTGAGSKTDNYCDTGESDFCSRQSGFVACAINRDRLRVAYRDFTGAELHVVDIPKRA